MFDKIKSRIDHARYCGITLQNTQLIEDNYLGLGYQIVECLECGRQSIIFRKDGNMYMEEFNEDMYFTLKKFKLELDDYYRWEHEMSLNNINIFSNVNEIIKYPIGMDLLMIYSTQELEYGTEKVINMPFYDAINYIRPN